MSLQCVTGITRVRDRFTLLCGQEATYMEDRIEKANDHKKEWVVPELKKIDVAEITAADGFFNDDGDGEGPSSS